MGAATKAELEAINKRLQRSVERSQVKVEALSKSLDRAKSKNRTLARSVEEGRARETATAEILRIISSSPTNTQPVFDAIAQAAFRLVGDVSAIVTRIVDGRLHLAAFTSTG